jgi:hypothetical protein
MDEASSTQSQSPAGADAERVIITKQEVREIVAGMMGDLEDILTNKFYHQLQWRRMTSHRKG